jgi:hypothetical protein
MILEQYYVTQPELPIMCCFGRLINNTGGYKSIGFSFESCISGSEKLTDLYATAATAEKVTYRERMGDSYLNADRFVRMSFEGNSARDEKLYVYTDTARNSGYLGISSDIYQCNIYVSANTNYLPTGASLTFHPSYFMFTEKELTLDSVTDLEHVWFDIQ